MPTSGSESTSTPSKSTMKTSEGPAAAATVLRTAAALQKAVEAAGRAPLEILGCAAEMAAAHGGACCIKYLLLAAGAAATILCAFGSAVQVLLTGLLQLCWPGEAFGIRLARGARCMLYFAVDLGSMATLKQCLVTCKADCNGSRHAGARMAIFQC